MKSKFLKNYTSNVPVTQTIYRIEQVLIRCGVNGIAKEYGPNGEVTAIMFTVDVGAPAPVMTVRLPANREKAQDALWRDYAGADISKDGKTCWNCRKKLKREDFRDQADRTAWKIVRDWVEVQMSMIQMQQATFDQVFLPYVWDNRRKVTFYDDVRSHGYAALLPEKTNQEAA